MVRSLEPDTFAGFAVIIEAWPRFGNWIPGDILPRMRHAGHEETEIKLRVANMAALRRQLRQMRARRLGRVRERNVLFDTPGGALRRAGKLLRIRWNNGDAVLTLKSPPPLGRSHGRRFKVRHEIEFPIDAEKVQAILIALGFVPGFRYEKYRTTYAVPGARNVKLELDETPIGRFLELEGMPAAIDQLARRLGFTTRDYITANYFMLFRQHCRATKRHHQHMLFAHKRNVRRNAP